MASFQSLTIKEWTFSPFAQFPPVQFRQNRLLLTLLVVLLSFPAVTNAKEEGQKLFNGRDLTGWKGDPEVWSVRDGQIVGDTMDHKVDANTFLIWQGGELGDFKLTYKARLEGDNNSGVQYRSKRPDPKSWRVIGYQADIHSNPPYVGMLYGEGLGRHILAERGQRATLETDPKKSVIEKEAFAVKQLDVSEWHEYSILAQGNRLIHQVDGETTIDVTDNHEKRLDRGILALQVHTGEPMTVYFKDFVLTKLDAGKGTGPAK